MQIPNKLKLFLHCKKNKDVLQRFSLNVKKLTKNKEYKNLEPANTHVVVLH